MNENIIRFSHQDSMIGILTEPKEQSNNRPAFIFVNSGLLHRIGPFRIYVSLSRKLAENGYTSFRIDLSGKGDSEARKSAASINENVKQDIKEAMDVLQTQKGINQFIVCGICTGADNAYEIGFNDPRVTGIIPIDGYAYPNLGFKLRHYLPKLLRLSSWLNLFSRVISKLTPKKATLNNTNLNADYRMIFPPADKFLTNMQKAIDKSKQFLVVYTGGWNEFNNYQNQFTDCFPNIGNSQSVEVSYNQLSDHTFILRKDKEWLIDKIVDWANSRFK